MKIKLHKSRVAHRLFLLLSLATFLPILFLLLPTLNYFQDNIEQYHQSQMAQAAKNLGLDIEERLDFLASEIMILAQDDTLVSMEQPLEADPTRKARLANWFDALTVIKPGQRPLALLNLMVPIPTLDNGEITRLTTGKPLQVTKEYNGAMQLYLYQLLDSQKPDSGVLIGKINKNYLFQIAEALPSYRAFGCVLSPYLQPIHCSKGSELPNLSSYQEKILATKTGKLKNDMSGETYLTAYWSEFHPQSFIQPDWTILFSTPAKMALAPWQQALYWLPIFLAISLLIVLAMSIKQIRRVITPLERLREGTKSVSNQNFHSQVKVDSGDEFEELANSFNAMSSQLGKQFNAMETMARIDRLILSTFDIENIVETILIRMSHAVPCEEVSIVIKDNDSDSSAKLYRRKESLSSEIQSEAITLHAMDITQLEENKYYLQLHHQDVLPNYIKALNASKMNYLLLPIFLEKSLSAVIVLMHTHHYDYQPNDIKQARDLADRVAVALSNAAWEDKLYQQAHYDNLTKLPNRLLFQDRIHHAIKRADREKTKIALMFLDLDHFKNLNDSLGHAAGDAFLIETAKRIKSAIRSVDTVSRLGGDEFTIIIPDLHHAQETITQVSAIASKILRRTALPTKIEDQDITLTVSIGIAMYPTDANNFSDLLKAADSALYYAKDRGKSNYQFYSKDIDSEAKALLKMESDLKQAMGKGEFELYYQPRIHLDSQQIVGAEALIRWKKNDEVISPKSFIPIAEDNGLIISLGDWVLKTACIACKNWHEAGFHHIRVAVNLSPLQFKDQELITRIRMALQQANLHPKYLELEITESTIMTDSENAIKTLFSLNKMGISLSIDDFGTGYSSLSYLKKFPIHLLKIDQSFIHDIHEDKDNHAIVSAIITLAEHLELGVVAEGVESMEELHLLRQKHCAEAQGYFYSKPLGQQAFESYLKNYQPDITLVNPDSTKLIAVHDNQANTN